MATSDTNRLDDLKSKFLQMTSPHEFGQERKKNVTITSRNVPPMLARADAAFLVLAERICNATPETAPDYDQLLAIALESRDQVKDADLLTKADQIHADFTDLIDSLSFLVCHLEVLKAVTAAGKNSCRRDGSICAAAYPEPEYQCRFYSTLEEQILISLQAALSKLCPAFLERRQLFLESLSKADMDRFARAQTEFTAYFKTIING